MRWLSSPGLRARSATRANARRHGREAVALADGSDLALNRFWADGALGFLELGEGNSDEAVAHLESARAFAEREGLRLMMMVPWAPDLVESYVRVGRRSDARQLVAALDGQLVASQGALAEALLLRCVGLVADHGAERSYREAIAAHTKVLAPFERARTLLSFGEWLRRERRPGEAVAPLEEAVRTFRSLGAARWHDRASAELLAHGRRPAAAPERSVLTPQEFRVARAVAGGATNREAAAALFLSPRTVEHHLVNVYRKLGIRSRSELARRVTADPDFTVHEAASADEP